MSFCPLFDVYVGFYVCCSMFMLVFMLIVQSSCLSLCPLFYLCSCWSVCPLFNVMLVFIARCSMFMLVLMSFFQGSCWSLCPFFNVHVGLYVHFSMFMLVFMSIVQCSCWPLCPLFNVHAGFYVLIVHFCLLLFKVHVLYDKNNQFLKQNSWLSYLSQWFKSYYRVNQKKQGLGFFSPFYPLNYLKMCDSKWFSILERFV